MTLGEKIGLILFIVELAIIVMILCSGKVGNKISLQLMVGAFIELSVGILLFVLSGKGLNNE